MGKGGSVSVKERMHMSEGAPGNPGAVAWPDDFTASVMVRRMQIKLHRWAGEDHSRRFGDLFNLVYDPAFLVHAWERVAGNKGARTPGVDKYYSRCFTLSADSSSLRGRARRFRDEPVRTDVTVSDGDRGMSRDEEQELR